MTDQAKGTNGGNPHPKFKYSVDGRPFENDVATITGAQIKATGGVDPGFGLFLEGHGGQPDRQIADAETIDLSEPGREQFYAMPPATFGAVH